MIHLQTITENKEWAISTSNDVYLRKYQIFRMVISIQLITKRLISGYAIHVSVHSVFNINITSQKYDCTIYNARGSVELVARPLLVENIDGRVLVTTPRLFRADLEKLSAKKGKISRKCSLSGFAASDGFVCTIKLTTFLRYT